MTLDILIVFSILIGTIVLFVLDRLRLDLVALLALLALLFTGILTPTQALAGFGDTTVILIAALFVVGDGLDRLCHPGQYLILVPGATVLVTMRGRGCRSSFWCWRFV